MDNCSTEWAAASNSESRAISTKDRAASIWTACKSVISRPSSHDEAIGVQKIRASYIPPDRNLIDRYADAGLEFIGLSDTRPHEKFGVAVAYAHVSPNARALDTDFRSIASLTWPIRSSETLLTVYQYEVKAGLTLQPNLQLVKHPGGGATNPLSTQPGRPLKDVAVLGLRTVVKFEQCLNPA